MSQPNQNSIGNRIWPSNFLMRTSCEKELDRGLCCAFCCSFAAFAPSRDRRLARAASLADARKALESESDWLFNVIESHKSRTLIFATSPLLLLAIDGQCPDRQHCPLLGWVSARPVDGHRLLVQFAGGHRLGLGCLAQSRVNGKNAVQRPRNGGGLTQTITKCTNKYSKKRCHSKMQFKKSIKDTKAEM